MCSGGTVMVLSARDRESTSLCGATVTELSVLGVSVMESPSRHEAIGGCSPAEQARPLSGCSAAVDAVDWSCISKEPRLRAPVKGDGDE